MSNNYQPDYTSDANSAGFPYNYANDLNQPMQFGQYPMQQAMPGQIPGKPDNNLILAILSTFFGFFPLGIAAIIISTKVDTLWQTGDVMGAWDAANKARKFSIWSFGIMVGSMILLFLMWIIGMAFLFSI